MASGADIATMKAVLDTSGMRQGAREGVAAMDQLGRGADKLESALLSVRGAAMKMAGVLGAYQFGQWIKGNIDLAARYETLGVVLQQVGKSAGYASSDITRLTSALQKQGISMMQSRQSVISMIQAKLELAKADQLAAVAQNAAVTAGLNSSETLQRIIYGITTGQTDVLRSVGIVTEFEVAYKKMAETLKKSVSDLTAAEKSQARVNAVIEAGKPIAGAYAASMDTAGKQAKSLERYVEDLRLKLGQAFQPANTALIFSTATAVKFLSENADALVVVLGGLIGRGLLPLINRFKDAGQVLLKNRAEAAAYAEDVVRNAAIQKAAAEQRLFALRAEQAEIRATAAAERERLAVANARVARAVDPSSLAVLGGAVAERDNAQVAFAMREQAAAREVLNKATERGVVVNGEIAAAQAAVAVTSEAVVVAQRAQVASTSIVSKALSGLGVVYTALGGWIGIALTAIAAFYASYSQKMQKAKEEIDSNADAIKKKLDEISEKRATSFTGQAAYDPKEANAYNQRVQELSSAVQVAGRNIRETSITFTQFLRDATTNMGKFGAGLADLLRQYESHQIGAKELVAGVDLLAARYPNMADAAQRAKEQVALLAIKQDELKKFTSETVAPLLTAAAAMDLWANAARSAAGAKDSNFLTPNLGDKGRQSDREIAELLRMQAAIKTGNKETIRDEQDRQAAERVAQSLIDERIKGNEKLASVMGKTRAELAAMGPVADKEIAQLKVDADATYAAEMRKAGLTRQNERLNDSLERSIRISREMQSFLEKAGGPGLTPDQQFAQDIADFRRSMRNSGVSDSVSDTTVAQAERYYQQGKLLLSLEQDFARSATDVQINLDAINERLLKQKKIFDEAKENLSGFAKVNKDAADQQTRIFILRGQKDGTLSAAQVKELQQQQLINEKYKEYKALHLSDEQAMVAAKAFAARQQVIDGLTASTNNWADAVKSVASSFSSLSQVLQQVGGDSVRMIGVTGSALGSLMDTMKKMESMQSDPNRQKMSGGQTAAAIGSGVVSTFAAGYAFGTTTTNKGAGALGGALTGAASGAAIGTAIAPGIGTAIGAVVGSVVGAIGGLVGANQAAKQLEAQLNLNAQKLAKALDAIRASFANDALGAAIAQTKQQFDDLRKSTEDVYRGRKNEPERYRILAEITRLEAIRIQQMRDEFNEQLKLSMASLAARAARAAGLNDEAARLEEASARTNEMTEAIKKYGADSTYVEKLREVQAAETAAAEAARKLAEDRKQFDSYASNGEFLARRLAATGQGDAAEALRQQIRNEAELREAREKNLDVTLLLAAQEAEDAQRKSQQAQAQFGRDQDFFVREVALTNGGIAAQLAQKAFDINNRANAALNPADRAREESIGARELEAMRRQFREQATSLIGGYFSANNTNPVVQAQTEATIRYAEAQTKLREYMLAGIITQEEYAGALAQVTLTGQRAIAEAQRQQERDRLGFLADSAQRRLSLDPTDRASAKKLYDLQGEMAYNDAYNNAVKLRDAGTITEQQFADFAEILSQQFSPAVRDAAFAVQEAARIMNDNLSTLNQQWGVFGTGAQGQLTDLTKLFGFDGMSFEQVQGLFTKMTPGKELTPAQKEMNDRVSQWVQAFNRASSASAEAADAVAQQTSGITTYSTSGNFESTSETTSLRLLDVGLSQLNALRSIENNTRAGSNGVVVQISISGATLNAASPQDLSNQIVQKIVPVLDEYQGRRVGVEKRMIGDPALS